MKLILHNYFRSSSSIRVRVAMNLKGLDYEYVAYALREKENESPAYLQKNPQGMVPALELEDGVVLTQSLAIMEWLEEKYPKPPLLPADAIGRARVRALSYAVACEIHPLNNLRVLQYLGEKFGADENAVAAWFRYWVAMTFAPLEKMLAHHRDTGRFCHGDTPGFADACLYAQVLNNQRFAVDMTPYPVIQRIYAACDAHEAFKQAAPMVQPDAV